MPAPSHTPKVKLHFSKGSSSLAAHILLTEVGARFKAVEVSIAARDHQSPGFLAINPKGRIPALETPQGVITENPAILEYVATMHPQADCLPQGRFALAEARSLCSYLASTVHVAFAHFRRGGRWADTPASHADMAQVAGRNLRSCAALLDQRLALSPWALDHGYSFCDPYLFLMQHWLRMTGQSLVATPRLQAHCTAMLARPATQSVLALYHDNAGQITSSLRSSLSP